MSTRSCVARKDDVRGGRYIHSDGYPSWNGIQLVNLIRRDGVEVAMNTLIDEHYGWSCLELDREELFDIQQDGRFELVPGYGVEYTEYMGQSSPDDWVNIETRHGTVFQYFIDDDGTIDVCYDCDPLFSVNAFDDRAEEIMQSKDPFNR